MKKERGRGRPKKEYKNIGVSLYLPPKYKRVLELEAEIGGYSISKYLMKLVEKAREKGLHKELGVKGSGYEK